MPSLRYFSDKLSGKIQRITSACFAQQSAELPKGRYISFCFDDFPQSAVRNAVPVLDRRAWKATWYACGSYMGRQHDTYGTMYTQQDLHNLIAEGHEIGCHTYDHIDCAKTDAAHLVAQSLRNARFLQAQGVMEIQSFAFPFGAASLASKQIMAGVAPALRGVQPGINRRQIDLRMLKACGIQDNAGGCATVYKMLEELRRSEGWLIVFTHDVCDTPSPWGCTPEGFDALLDAVAQTDAEILTVGDMVARLRGSADITAQAI